MFQVQPGSDRILSSEDTTAALNKSLEELSLHSNKLILNKRFAANVIKLIGLRGREGPPELLSSLQSALNETLSKIRLIEHTERQQLVIMYLFQSKISNEFDGLYQYLKRNNKNNTQDIHLAILESDRRTDEIETSDFVITMLADEDTYIHSIDLPDSDLKGLVTEMRRHVLTTFSKNSLDQVMAGVDRLEGILRSRASCTNVYSIPIIPSDFMEVDSHREFKGCYSLVRQSRMKNGRIIAVKAIDPLWMQEGDIVSRRDREIYIWAGLPRHENILQLLGAVTLSGLGIALISPWVSCGSSLDYIKKFPEAPRLPVFKGILEGLTFLHTRNPPVVHGDLRGSHVLISDHGTPMLSGFSLGYIPGHSRLILPDLHGVISFRWMAYELLETDRIFEPTRESDMWAFGMLVIELLTGLEPFSNYAKDAQVLIAIRHKKELPTKPVTEAEKFKLSSKLWYMIEACWSEIPCMRLSASEVLEAFNEVVKDEIAKELQALRAPVITEEIDLESIPSRSVAEGNFGEVRQCRLKDGTLVAVKTLKATKLKLQKVEQSKRFKREVSIWARLDHPNILPLLGLVELPGLSLSLASPWIETGNIHAFLSSNPGFDRLSLVTGVISGLAYLHNCEPPVIHGDLRGHNILVNAHGVPLLCDFGLAIISEELGGLPISTVLQGSGNCRWMPHEMLFGTDPPTKGCDVWAFGMVVIEIFTNRIPYQELVNDAQVVLAVYAGQLPRKPDSFGNLVSDCIWEIIERCWASNKDDRPSASDLLEELRAIASFPFLVATV